MRHKALLVRQRSKLKIKVLGILAYEGIEPISGCGLLTRKGVKWLRSLCLETVYFYFKFM